MPSDRAVGLRFIASSDGGGGGGGGRRWRGRGRDGLEGSDKDQVSAQEGRRAGTGFERSGTYTGRNKSHVIHWQPVLAQQVYHKAAPRDPRNTIRCIPVVTVHTETFISVGRTLHLPWLCPVRRVWSQHRFSVCLTLAIVLLGRSSPRGAAIRIVNVLWVQLDRSYLEGQPPHHVPESLSELTLTVYLARRLPLQVRVIHRRYVCICVVR